MPRLEIIGQHRGLAAESAVGILQDRDQVGAKLLGFLAQRLGHDDPVEGDAAVAHQGAQLDRIGRCRRSDEPVAHFAHSIRLWLQRRGG